MNEEPAQSAPRRKVRSPSYPGIDLELAIERAKTLWDNEHHYPTAVPTILSHWGYGAKSGGGFAAIAALKSFGLLEDEGSGSQRQAWLTKPAQSILTTEDDEERQRLIKEAAILPAAHREIWDRYGARLPSDQSLKLFLMQERSFSPSGAEELVSEWKRTMKFARLTGGPATVASNGDSARKDKSKDPDSAAAGGNGMTPPPAIKEPPAASKTPPAGSTPPPSGESPERQQRSIQIPHLPDPADWAMVQARFPMSEQEWDAMIAVLQSMKIGLVKKPDED